MAGITQLSDLPLEALAPLVAESQQEGWKMLQRMVDEWTEGINRFEKPGEALYAAWMG